MKEIAGSRETKDDTFEDTFREHEMLIWGAGSRGQNFEGRGEYGTLAYVLSLIIPLHRFPYIKYFGHYPNKKGRQSLTLRLIGPLKGSSSFEVSIGPLLDFYGRAAISTYRSQKGRILIDLDTPAT